MKGMNFRSTIVYEYLSICKYNAWLLRLFEFLGGYVVPFHFIIEGSFADIQLFHG